MTLRHWFKFHCRCCRQKRSRARLRFLGRFSSSKMGFMKPVSDSLIRDTSAISSCMSCLEMCGRQSAVSKCWTSYESIFFRCGLSGTSTSWPVSRNFPLSLDIMLSLTPNVAATCLCGTPASSWPTARALSRLDNLTMMMLGLNTKWPLWRSDQQEKLIYPCWATCRTVNPVFTLSYSKKL